MSCCSFIASTDICKEQAVRFSVREHGTKNESAWLDLELECLSLYDAAPHLQCFVHHALLLLTRFPQEFLKQC